MADGIKGPGFTEVTTPNAADVFYLQQSVNADGYISVANLGAFFGSATYTVETATDNKTITSTASNYLLLFTRQATAKVVTLDDATASTGKIRRIRVTGAGVGNVSLATVSSQTIGGFAASDWDWDGTGQLSIISDGSNWQILEEGIWDTYTADYDSITYPQKKYTNGYIVKSGNVYQPDYAEASLYTFLIGLMPNTGETMNAIGAVQAAGTTIERHISRIDNDGTGFTAYELLSNGSITTDTIRSDGSGTWVDTNDVSIAWETKNTIWYTP